MLHPPILRAPIDVPNQQALKEMSIWSDQAIYKDSLLSFTSNVCADPCNLYVLERLFHSWCVDHLSTLSTVYDLTLVDRTDMFSEFPGVY